jgi:Amt family ammonium transporter
MNDPTTIGAILCTVSLMLIPLAAAGLALIHQGLGRSRSAAHAMLATLCVLSISAIVFVTIGSGWAGYPGGLTHSFLAGGVRWDWLGAVPSSASISFQGMDAPRLNRCLVLCLEMFAAGLAAIIPLSAGTDRWRLGPICLASALFAALPFPLFAHWVWGGGWLARLDANFGLPAFLDVGGAGVVQAVGGLMALSVAWIMGPRRGKYTQDGVASAIPGHNIVQVMFGCLLALVGWIGLDAAVTLLFHPAPAEQVVGEIAGVIVNAMLSASGGCLAAVVVTRVRYRKPDASIGANGWIAGLVAGSAACALVSPIAAIDTGLLAGVLVTYMVEVFELHLLVDDPGGAISVHACAGLWGLIAVGLFGHFPEGTRGAHLLAQIVGIAALLGFMLPLLHAMNLLLNRFLRYRVDGDGDWQGMDIRELGAGAYPEFVVHADEFVPR